MMLFSILTASLAATALPPQIQSEAEIDEAVEAVVETEVETSVDAGTAEEAEVEQAAIASEEEAIVETVVEEAQLVEATPVRLVSWDGDSELLKVSQRMRIWRSHIAFRLTVDAQGNATECELTETFRRKRVNDRLCEVLLANHTFEPAHDETGTAVEGSYSDRMSYLEIRERL